MAKTYSHPQLKGAYKAGYDDGFKAGYETMQREGWRRGAADSDFREGQVVKCLVETTSGWRGMGRVLYIGRSVVTVEKLSGVDETADYLFDQVAVKVVERAA